MLALFVFLSALSESGYHLLKKANVQASIIDEIGSAQKYTTKYVSISPALVEAFCRAAYFTFFVLSLFLFPFSIMNFSFTVQMAPSADTTVLFTNTAELGHPPVSLRSPS